MFLDVLQVVRISTRKVLSHISWVEAPEEVVLKVLRLQKMAITERLLFARLVKWGRAQATNEEEVRAKIDKGLKLIRFYTMECSEFSSLCHSSIPLTSEEKYKLFLVIARKSTKHYLPEGFSNI
jgi:hypothetical protein